LRDDIDRFRSRGASVYGLNPAGPDSHRNYAEKKGFNFLLLSDPDREVCRRYHALKDDGKGILRTVYVVDRKGKISNARRGMPPDKVILEAIR
jgi:peroxiredoxin Q/BCP